ncbi:transposase [Methylobacterium sp. P1-11]|nr:transposase [Methylobacterium sp. P1-11]
MGGRQLASGLATLIQLRESLSAREAAEPVRAQIDWKYLLALDLIDPGSDHSLLCEFLGWILQHAASERLPARILDTARSRLA